MVRSASNEDLSNLLNLFASWNRCFTVWDVAVWLDEAIELNQLRQSFCNDSRFILLSQSGVRDRSVSCRNAQCSVGGPGST